MEGWRKAQPGHSENRPNRRVSGAEGLTGNEVRTSIRVGRRMRETWVKKSSHVCGWANQERDGDCWIVVREAGVMVEDAMVSIFPGPTFHVCKSNKTIHLSSPRQAFLGESQSRRMGNITTHRREVESAHG